MKVQGKIGLPSFVNNNGGPLGAGVMSDEKVSARVPRRRREVATPLEIVTSYLLGSVVLKIRLFRRTDLQNS